MLPPYLLLHPPTPCPYNFHPPTPHSPPKRWAAGVKEMRATFQRLEAEGYPAEAQVMRALNLMYYEPTMCDD
jgi:hypothetical protein